MPSGDSVLGRLMVLTSSGEAAGSPSASLAMPGRYLITSLNDSRET